MVTGQPFPLQQTTQMRLLEAARVGCEAFVRVLFEEGADVAAKNEFGWTALSLAATNGHDAVVRLLLKEANVQSLLTKDENRSTALHWAAKEGHDTIVQLLLEYGANIAAKNELGWTALSIAASNGHDAAVRLLLKHGANVRPLLTKDENRPTAS